MTREERKAWRRERLPASIVTLGIIAFCLVKVLIRAL